MKKSVLALIAVILIVLAFFVGRQTKGPEGDTGGAEAAGKAELYTCGMHPEVIQEGPGDCPICGMFLTPMEVQEAETSHDDTRLYTCGMHPEVIQEGPGDCPICGMFLTPMEIPGDAEAPSVPDGERTVLYWRAPMDPSYISEKPGKSPMGMDLVPVYEDEVSSGNIKIDPVVMQNMGITTEKVKRGPFAKTIKTYGTLDWDETTRYKVNTKVAGWIEKLYVDQTGQHVKRGQPLLSIFSPDLVASQAEYLAALSSARKLSSSPNEDVSAGGRELLDAARRRLELWDISGKQITELEESGVVRRTLTLYAPAGGVVVHKAVIQGDHVTPGMDLMEVASPDRLWLQASLYEQDIPLVIKGTKADVAFDNLPGELFEAEVDYVYPTVEGKSRTTEARLVLSNRNGRLKPGMYASVAIGIPVADDALTIPADAVIRASSEKAVVFVARGGGRFSGREVVLGPEGDGGMVLVKAGLKEGEMVVTSAQFLLDSESRIQAAVQSMLERKKAAMESDGHDH